MARHSGAITPIIQQRLQEVSAILSDAINGNKIDDEGLIVPREFVNKLLEEYLVDEEFEKCEKVKKFIESNPAYIKDITAQEWIDNYLMKKNKFYC